LQALRRNHPKKNKRIIAEKHIAIGGLSPRATGLAAWPEARLPQRVESTSVDSKDCLRSGAAREHRRWMELLGKMGPFMDASEATPYSAIGQRRRD
jgi:hypothetical protein